MYCLTILSINDTLIDELHLEGVYTQQDNINSSEEVVLKLNKISLILIIYNLILSVNKCSFRKKAINYVGFHNETHCISLVQSNIIKINPFAVPITKRQVKKFIGLVIFYKF